MLYTSQDFQPHHAVWSSNTCHQGTGPFRLVMQPDNNLVIYDSHNHGGLERWFFAKRIHTHTSGRSDVVDQLVRPRPRPVPV